MKYVKSSGDRAVVRLRDNLDYKTASAVIEEIKAVAAGRIRRIDFCCDELQNISNAGIRSLIFIKQKIGEGTDIKIVLHNVAKPVKDVLILSGMDGYVDFTD